MVTAHHPAKFHDNVNGDDITLRHQTQTCWWLYQYVNNDTICADSRWSNTCLNSFQ